MEPVSLRICQHKEHNTEDKCPFNLKIFIHDNKNEYISNFITKRGYYEKYMTEVFIELVKICNINNYIFIDIGSNIGYYSLLAGALNIKTYAFEPVTKNYELCKKSIEYNKLDITLEKYAIGCNTTSTLFALFDSNMGGCTKMDNCSVRKIKYDDTEMVNFISLDTYYIKNINQDKKLILKIDVEEEEIDVLNSMSEHVINKTDYVFIEICTSNTNVVFEYFVKHGFKYYINIGFDNPKLDDNLIISINHNINHIISNNIYNIKVLTNELNQCNLLFIKDLN